MLLFLSILCLLSPIAFFVLLIGKRKKPLRAPQSATWPEKRVFPLEKEYKAAHELRRPHEIDLKTTPKPRPAELDEIEDTFYSFSYDKGILPEQDEVE